MIEQEPRERPSVRANILNPEEAKWNNKIDSLRQSLGAPNNPYLFPPHFIKRTLVSIGGSVIEYREGRKLLGAGFLFPRRVDSGMGFTLRFHRTSQNLSPNTAYSLATELVRNKFGYPLPVHLYIPELNAISESYSPLESARSGVVLEGTAPGDEVHVRNLQREIWGVTSDDFLYPEDIHAKDFALPTSLTAHVAGKAVGFLFGFDKFYFGELPEGLRGLISNPFIRQESQLMGVLPGHRLKSIATMLKIRQAQEAIKSGTEIINWTYDPLLSQNGALNLNRLGGVVWDHSPNYYAFSGANKLNQVTASRFNVSWLISSPRVEEAIGDKGQDGRLRRALKDDLLEGNITIINSTKEYGSIDGEETRAIEDTYAHFVDENEIAIEIPVNWTSIQGKDIPLAQQWRNVTDEIFGEYIGSSREKYVITDVVMFGGNGTISRVFLVAKSIDQVQNVFLGEV